MENSRAAADLGSRHTEGDDPGIAHKDNPGNFADRRLSAVCTIRLSDLYGRIYPNNAARNIV
jgi:hypothetical protein